MSPSWQAPAPTSIFDLTSNLSCNTSPPGSPPFKIRKQPVVYTMKSDFLFYPLFQEELNRLVHHPGRKEARYLVRIEKEVALPDPVLDLVLSCRVPEKFYYSAKDAPLNSGDWEAPW